MLLPPRPRALLIDAGDTLCTERASRATLYAQYAERCGLSLDADRVASAMAHAHEALPMLLDGQFRYSRRWFEAFIPEVVRRSGGAPTATQQRALIELLFDAFSGTEAYRAYDESESTLRALREDGIRIGVVSNWAPHLPRLLDALGLAVHCDVITVSASEGIEKPTPALFQRALDRLDIAPEDAVHVGNHPIHDVEGARRAGVTSILLDRTGALAAHVSPDTPVIPTLTPLRAWCQVGL